MGSADAQDEQEALAARKRELAQAAREQFVRDTLELVSTAAGRRWIAWLTGEVGIRAQTYSLGADGRGDPMATAFHEGRRSVGILVEATVDQADPEALIRMQVEHLQRVRSARAQRDAAEKEAAAKADSR